MALLALDHPRQILSALKNEGISLDFYLNAVEEHFNETEPNVQAFIPEKDRFKRLHKEAKQLANQYPTPESRPELFGLLIGVKDIFHVDGFPTQAGSQLPAKALAGTQAESVTRLKKAGALVFGKTVTTEFAYFAPGPTKNPHNPNHTPGGSSSGSAAAVADDMVPLALGTQTIGSVIRPASFCGTFGFKPSYDRISREGVIPLSNSLDHVGLFAQNIGLGTLAAKHLITHWKTQDTLKAFPTLAIPTGTYLDKASPEMREHFNNLVSRLKNNRFKILEINLFEDFQAVYDNHQIIMSAEAAAFHKDLFAKYESDYHHRTAELIKTGMQVSESDLQMAYDKQKMLRSKIMKTMQDNGIDLWIAPSAPGPAPEGLDSTGDPIMNLPWSQAGLPSVNLPSGKNEHGLPLGLQVIAGWNQDENLFAWCPQIQQGIQG